MRRPVTAAEALLEVRRRFEQRSEDFLALARQAIYDQPTSPYRWLLARARCDSATWRVSCGRRAWRAPSRDSSHAAVHAGHDRAGSGALLLTSLRPRAPVVLFNASLGDRATLVNRRCGCPLDAYGWSTHVGEVVSDEKVTAGGMTFLDSDVAWVLESVLPGRFGGSGPDYQLLEEEEPDGRTALRLLVDPSVGPVEPDALCRVFLEGLRGVSQAAPVMVMTWEAARLVRVERRSPLRTSPGKILHVRRAGPKPSREPPRGQDGA